MEDEDGFALSSIFDLLSSPAISCAAPERIPTYPPMPVEERCGSWRIGRMRFIRFGAGEVTLTRADGESVRFDTAVVLAPPERARVRAWKFGQACLT